MSSTERGPMRRFVAALAQSKSDQHAEALRDDVRDLGVASICDCKAGEQAAVRGVLRSVSLRPWDGIPAVEAELFDGSGRVLVIWLGRRRIHGIEPGRGIFVEGRVTGDPERPTIFNPRYTLLPPSRSAS